MILCTLANKRYTYVHICIGNKHFTPKTASYKALTTDYLDINCELNNSLSCHMYTSLLSNTHKIVIHRAYRPLLACVFSVHFGK